MAIQAQDESLDCVKVPDDFPPQLAPDIYRVGALRRAVRLVNGPEDPFLVHPKFMMFRESNQFKTKYFQNIPRYSDEELYARRSQYAGILHGIERLDVDEAQRVRHGDQLTFHYELAAKYLPEHARLLDVACGDGFGVRLLADRCSSVNGVDHDEQSVAIARSRSTGRSKLAYSVADCTRMPFPDGAFNAVLSMETLEHVPVNPFLKEVERVLEPGGCFVASTPQSSLGHIPMTPAHEREFSLAELTNYLASVFEITEIIGLKAGTVFFPGDPIGTNSFAVCRRL